ncbi:hypothetical protein K4F52_007644 [Lecanicillium sp. MT-2017a]|nr:hypothetical protein K4F52_007644 [Lecanicillium sp. MT-2017a]
MNLTRNTKSSLKAVKSQLLQMAIWHGQKPSTLTPRTLALQLLHILSRDADPSCLEDISRDINKDISRISLTYSAADSHGDIDYALIIYALEAQSNLMPLESNEYAPAIAGFLRQSLHNWPSRRGSLDKATLKLAINTGNTKSGATIFDEPSLLSSLAASISTGFALVQAAVEKDAFENELYDELLLILGIIINVLEHCPDARASMDGGSLDALTGLWVNSSSIVNDAESVGQSKLGVALGYLAITIGYLYLAPSGRLQMREHKNWPGTKHLINSIQEFLGIIKAVDNKMQELDVLVSDLRKEQLAER